MCVVPRVKKRWWWKNHSLRLSVGTRAYAGWIDEWMNGWMHRLSQQCRSLERWGIPSYQLFPDDTGQRIVPPNHIDFPLFPMFRHFATLLTESHYRYIKSLVLEERAEPARGVQYGKAKSVVRRATQTFPEKAVHIIGQQRFCSPLWFWHQFLIIFTRKISEL